MPDTVWTILVAAATAVVTATATSLIVAPRMEARKKRLGEVHTARDAFGAHMLRIISACSLLQNTPLPAPDDPDWTATMRERLTGERDRWLQQLDDATLWLIDNVATYAASWPGRHLIQFAVEYAGTARMVMLSERDDATKVQLLLALTVPVQRQYFGWPWARARHALADRRTFAQTLAHINGAPTAP
ncbi:hypothetical protein [Streptomyces melanogenes]|uniref:hypothetical protein n=1 Tax=Streptomyces melanogenes TaxID=67326 RepID=UPI00167C4E7B|nr:hypothetical protein [Streptomyces melanogenes]GGP93931.1 hypothetical protein GCM10010278_84950 [Streptomyces melanogenes]